MEIAIHYIWLRMFPAPMEHAALPAAADRVQDGPNVVQYWDGQAAVGKRLGEIALELGVAEPEDEIVQVSRSRYDGTFVAWDAYALFDADATWATAEEHLLGWGAPIVREKVALLDQLDGLAAETDRRAAAAAE